MSVTKENYNTKVQIIKLNKEKNKQTNVERLLQEIYKHVQQMEKVL